MSEQTPNSPENMQDSSMGEGEPSMEDILASIRKIISEDEPVALESPEDFTDISAVSLESDAELERQAEVDADLDNLSDVDGLSRDVVDIDLDAMLAKIDKVAEESVTLEAPVPPMPVPEKEAVELDDEDILAMLDMDIPLEDDLSEADIADKARFSSLDAEAMFSDMQDDSLETEATFADDEMDSLLDDILARSDEVEPMEMDLPAFVETDPDLDLVKSLMADLSDDIGAETAQGSTEEDYIADLDALLAIPEIEPEVEAEELSASESEDTVDLVGDAEDESEDILGDILNMTLEDEIQNHPDEISPDTLTADEIANVEANRISDQITEAKTADELPSLSEIAAAAEADAQAIESPVQAPTSVTATAGLVAGAAGVAALGATALGQAEPEPTDADETEIQLTEADEIAEALEAAAAEAEAAPTLDLEPEHTEQEQSQQEPAMPVKAVNTDTILDDVTEAAAADAFAQLNSVVEEKAVYTERGPRIGDLVQEALRPMLKDWLDANLKGIVERAVAKEVKRISTGK